MKNFISCARQDFSFICVLVTSFSLGNVIVIKKLKPAGKGCVVDFTQVADISVIVEISLRNISTNRFSICCSSLLNFMLKEVILLRSNLLKTLKVGKEKKFKEVKKREKIVKPNDKRVLENGFPDPVHFTWHA